MTNSDLAFWGDHAFQGYYSTTAQRAESGSSISRTLLRLAIKDFKCDGQQNDPILWDRNGKASSN
jgi:hypothetical protein